MNPNNRRLNEEKIRAEILNLLGYRQEAEVGSLRGVWFHNNLECDPPDPLSSIECLLPLMQEYWIDLGPRFGEGDWVAMGRTLVGAGGARRLGGAYFRVLHDRAATAICCCALLCAGFDLKHFMN